MFQLTEPTKPTKPIKQMRDQPIKNDASKKANQLSLSLFALFTNPANKNGYGAYLLFGAQDYSLCGAHWAYKGYYLSSDEHQAYKTYYLSFQSKSKSLQGLPRSPKSCGSSNRLVGTVIELVQLFLQG